jgi:hypothetical protein
MDACATGIRMKAVPPLRRPESVIGAGKHRIHWILSGYHSGASLTAMTVGRTCRSLLPIIGR